MRDYNNALLYFKKAIIADPDKNTNINTNILARKGDDLFKYKDYKNSLLYYKNIN